MVWLCLSLSVVIKVSISFIGPIKGFANLFFFLDGAIGFFIVIGIYWFLEEIHRKYYYAYGHYVIIDLTCLLLSSLIFTAFTKIQLKKNMSSFLLSACVMMIGNAFIITMSQNFWTTNPLEFI